MPPKKAAAAAVKEHVVYKRADPSIAQVNYDTYKEQVLVYVPPVVIEAFTDIYQDACTHCRSELQDPLLQQRFKVFQQLLKEVNEWEEDIVDEEAERFREQIPWLRDALRQILINQVNILLSMKNDRYITNAKFTFEMPTENEIVYHIMKNCARAVKPHARLFDHDLEDIDCQTNLAKMDEVVRRAVELSISSLVPIADIVKAQYGEKKKRAAKQQKKAEVLKPQVEKVKEEDGFKEDSSSDGSISQGEIERMSEKNKKHMAEVDEKQEAKEQMRAAQEKNNNEQDKKEVTVNEAEHIDNEAQNVDQMIAKLKTMKKDDPERAVLKNKIKTLL